MSTLQFSELQAFPQFGSVPQTQLEWLTRNIVAEEIPEGGFIFEKGDPIDRMILVLEGAFEIYLSDGKNKKAFERQMAMR